jgi:hypothetical protein
VDPIRPTAPVAFGGLTADVLPRPGHRSPVDVAADRRESLRHEGAGEMHAVRSLLAVDG